MVTLSKNFMKNRNDVHTVLVELCIGSYKRTEMDSTSRPVFELLDVLSKEACDGPLPGSERAMDEADEEASIGQSAGTRGGRADDAAIGGDSARGGVLPLQALGPSDGSRLMAVDAHVSSGI